MIHFREFETKTAGALDAIDVTGDLEHVVKEAGIDNGVAVVFSPHTTCCILVGPRDAAALRAALARTMDTVAPRDAYYAHDDLEIRTENLVEDEPPNARSHLLHVFAGRPSECIPVVGGELALSPDQRVLFVELDTARARRYCVQVIGT